nr:G protein-coupled receptor [Proales similis]
MKVSILLVIGLAMRLKSELTCTALLPARRTILLQWEPDESASCGVAQNQGYLRVTATASNPIDQYLVDSLQNCAHLLVLVKFSEIDLKSDSLNADTIYLISQRFNLKFERHSMTPGLCKTLIYNSTQPFALFASASIQNVHFYHSLLVANLCPLLFRNAHFNLIINALTQSMIKTNRMLFDEWQAPVGAVLSEFRLEMFRTHLRPVGLSNALMQNTSSLFLLGQIECVQEDLFVYFKQLRRVLMRNNNLKELFHRGLGWMKHLNQRFKASNKNYSNPFERLFEISSRLMGLFIIEESVKIGSKRLNNSYNYPNTDLCLFKDFPHQRLVLPFLVNDQRECTCTAFFLKKQVLELDPLDGSIGTIIGMAVDMQYEIYEQRIACDYNRMMAECELDERLSLCQLSSTSSNASAVVLTYQDALVITRIGQYVLDLYLMPVACLASFISNFLLLITLRRDELLKEKMMQFVWMTGVFNLGLTMTYPFDLLSLCLSQNSIFCSSEWSSLLAQYTKIIVLGFLQNLFKFSSSMCLVLVSAQRYALASGDTQSCFVKLILSKSRPRLITFILTLASLLSVVKIFQYQVMDSKRSYYFDHYYSTYQFPVLKNFVISRAYVYGSGLELTYDLLSLGVYLFFDFVNLICNHLGCFLFNMVFDLLLLRVARSNVKSKTRLCETSHSMKQDKVLQAEATAQRIIKLVIVNSASSFLLRLPDVALSLYYSISYGLSRFNLFDIASVCETNPPLCSSLFNIVSVFYVVSTSLPFFFILSFSKKFRASFKQLRTMISIRFGK